MARIKKNDYYTTFVTLFILLKKQISTESLINLQLPQRNVIYYFYCLQFIINNCISG